jgi:hypothetical protein
MLFLPEVSLRMPEKASFHEDLTGFGGIESRKRISCGLIHEPRFSTAAVCLRSERSQAHSRFLPRFQVDVMRGPGSKPSLLFQLVVPATAIFAVTVLSMIAIVFSDPRAPVAQWLDRHGNRLLAAEFVVVIVLSLLAMTADRIQTLRQMQQPKSDLSESVVAQPTDQTSAAENKIAKAQTPSPSP